MTRPARSLRRWTRPVKSLALSRTTRNVLSPPVGRIVQRGASWGPLPVTRGETQADPDSGRGSRAGQPRTGGPQVPVQSVPRVATVRGRESRRQREDAEGAPPTAPVS